MKLRHLFNFNLFVAVFFGGGCTFFPRFVFGLYGLTPDEAGIWVARLAGGSILGFAALLWFGMRTPIMEARKEIALALMIQDSIGCIASIIFQLSGKPGGFGWFSLAMYGALAGAYAFFLFIRPDAG